MRKNVLKVLVASFTISAIIAILIILFGSIDIIEAKILATTLIIFIYSIPGLSISSLYDKEKYKKVAIIGLITLLLACIHLLGSLWGILGLNFFDSEQWPIFATFNILGFSIGHLSLILMIQNNNEIVKTFKNLTIIFALIFDSMLIIPIWTDAISLEGFYFRLMWVVFILEALGSIITPIMNKIYSDNKEEKDNVVIEKKIMPKRQKTLLIVIGSALILTICLALVFFKNQDKFVIDRIEDDNIADMIDNIPNGDLYEEASYYFIYNEKIYFYDCSLDKEYNLSDNFYSMNLDGTNKKLITQNTELRYATFYFVYNNEAYFYSPYEHGNKKINLTTGDINALNIEDIYVSKTLNDGMINTFIDNAVYGNNYSRFTKIDLKSGGQVYSVTINDTMVGKKYYLDYAGGNIYYLNKDGNMRPAIYKNTERIYEFMEYDSNRFEDFAFIASNGNYLYFMIDNHVYKLNVVTRLIEKALDYNLGEIHRISSGNNYDNYYYISNKIYELDFNTDTFKLVLKNVTFEPTEVYHINNKLIFTRNAKQLYYKYNHSDLGKVLIYDISLQRIVDQYQNVIKFDIDSNYAYMLTTDREEYYVEKMSL